MAPSLPAYTDVQFSRRQSPGPLVQDSNNQGQVTGDWRSAAQAHPEDLVLESWSQGFVVGALIVMACITIANMRKGVLLHKLILLELLLAMSHGTFCFMTFDGYGWYLSATAAMLYLSWIIHNIVAWMKVRPFFTHPGGFFKAKTGMWVKRIYLGSLALTVPVIIFQIQDNFRFFNNRGGWYRLVRPYEPLFRDPWWVFTCLVLFHVIRRCYGTTVIDLVKRSPRFGILLSAIALSLIFTAVDIVASIHSFVGVTDGINPWWKLSLVFKCLTDTIMLDDFKTELKRLGIKRIEKEEARRNSVALVTEYPAGLEGPDDDDYSRPRRETLFRYNNSPLQSTNTTPSARRDENEDPLTSFNPQHQPRSNNHNFNQMTRLSSNDSTACDPENEDPLSDNATQKEQHSQKPHPEKKRGTNDPSADMEEVEFATALALGPPESQGTSKKRHAEERTNIRTSTKKIARLPGLKEFRFEAIKPGKKSRGNNKQEGVSGAGEGEESFHARNLAEEIQRNTIMDLEAQKRKKEGNSGGGGGSGIRNGNAGVATDDSDEEDRQRFRRFRESIGANNI